MLPVAPSEPDHSGPHHPTKRVPETVKVINGCHRGADYPSHHFGSYRTDMHHCLSVTHPPISNLRWVLCAKLSNMARDCTPSHVQCGFLPSEPMDLCEKLTIVFKKTISPSPGRAKQFIRHILTLSPTTRATSSPNGQLLVRFFALQPPHPTHLLLQSSRSRYPSSRRFRCPPLPHTCAFAQRSAARSTWSSSGGHGPTLLNNT